MKNLKNIMSIQYNSNLLVYLKLNISIDKLV